MELSLKTKNEIVELLAQAGRADCGYRQFGAEKHRYQLNPPIAADKIREIEKAYGFRLPEDYFWFLTEVGNGGAGSDYGLYEFGTHDQEEDFLYLALPHVMEPKATEQDYEDFISYYESDDCSDEEFDTLWQGLLTIGTAGCTYDTLLVVSGTNRGRILHVDRDRQRPYFSPDASFLDWYIRWLTETVNGYEMRGFQARIGGNFSELIARYPQADEDLKTKIVESMYKFKTAEPKAVAKIVEFYHMESSSARKNDWLAHLARFEYTDIDRLFRAALRDQALCCGAIETLWRYLQRPELKSRGILGKSFRVMRRHLRKFHGNTKMIDHNWRNELREWYADVLWAFPIAVNLAPDKEDDYCRSFSYGADLIAENPAFRSEDIEPILQQLNSMRRADLYKECAANPLSYSLIEGMFAQLDAASKARKYSEIRDILDACCLVCENNPKMAREFKPRIAAICKNLLEDFRQHSPTLQDPYIQNYVRQSLKEIND